MSIFSRYGIELDKNSKTRDAVISYLSPLGMAYHSGLKKGDIVVSLNGKKISSLEEFIKIFIRYRSKISKMKIHRDNDIYSIEFSKNIP